ncbi:hypothetical protein EXN66_Car005499 [Channa argus]|uniref:Uncharacterized protein n=1 Tax=Channa argus TaxID=215402 RepID=A0A6G1PHW6_CHAAH|nr:hypothetical protein EXN66_Car005499 [Channa argus]
MLASGLFPQIQAILLMCVPMTSLTNTKPPHSHVQLTTQTQQHGGSSSSK